MGHGFLYQSDAAGRIGAIFARSQNPHGRREKVGFGGSSAARGSPESSSKFAILSDSARYPSGPRERSAKPPFVGSNPTRASKLLVSNQWITAFVSFPGTAVVVQEPTPSLARRLFRRVLSLALGAESASRVLPLQVAERSGTAPHRPGEIRRELPFIY